MNKTLKENEIPSFCLDTLKKMGADKSQISFNHKIKKEMSVEGEKVSLLRTVYSDEVFFKVIKNNKAATLTINKTDSADLEKACKQVMDLTNASPEDPHKDIAIYDEKKVFKNGSDEPNFDQMYEKLTKFKHQTNTKYPKVILRDVVLFHNHTKTYLQNSNGVDFEVSNGSYEMFTMFTAKDGVKTSSFNYDGVWKKELDGEILSWGQIDELLRQIVLQTDLRPVPMKFTGDIIVAPFCLLEMLDFLTNELKDGKHITKTSLFSGKLKQEVLNKKFTLKSLVLGDEFAQKHFITPDGFLAGDCTIFDKGVLKSNLLSQYGANKTSQERAKSYGGNLWVLPGDKNFAQMIKGIKKGILLQRFSGGFPSANGDFSGVAKNSFYIENGEITYPINETMITGNIIDLFKNIENISSEQVNYGHSILPWMQSSGLVISGK